MAPLLHGPNAHEPGQIGLVHQTDIWARIISLFEGGSPVTHCVLALDNGYCIAAEPRGARIRNVSEIRDVVWSAFPLTPGLQEDLVAVGRSFSGTPYSLTGAILIGVSLLLGQKHMPKWMLRRLYSENHLQCAQLVDDVYTRCGVHLFTTVAHRALSTPPLTCPSFGRTDGSIDQAHPHGL